AERIHALPEATVLVDGELLLANAALERLAFERARRIRGEVLEERMLEEEEAAVDEPGGGLRLLVERLHDAAHVLDLAEAARRTHGGERREALRCAVEVEHALQRHVGDAVAVRDREGLAGAEVLRRDREAGARHGRGAGLDQRDLPARAVTRLAVELDRAGLA